MGILLSKKPPYVSSLFCDISIDKKMTLGQSNCKKIAHNSLALKGKILKDTAYEENFISVRLCDGVGDASNPHMGCPLLR
jgi:hypothetical protein